MRTRYEIKKHLCEVGYSCKSIMQIMFFLKEEVDMFSTDSVLCVKQGDKNFNHFLKWFNKESVKYLLDDIRVGDCVHVMDDCDIIVTYIGEENRKIVIGTDGQEIGCFALSKKSRFANEDEFINVQNRMIDNALFFDREKGVIVPLSEKPCK